jgi:hypothetical protein
MVDDILLLRSPPPTSCERMVDLMVLEAGLMNQRIDTEGGASTPCVLSVIPLLLKKNPVSNVASK